MTKTIEDAARKQIHKLSLSFTKELHNDATIPYHTCRDALMWLFARPLRDRLTAEEKERVRKEYANTYPKDPDQSIASIRVMQTLERIFGADFFKEEE